MPRRKSRSSSNSFISPINPSLHFVIFLILALVLVVVVAAAMQKTSTDTRALLVCPQQSTDQVRLVEELSKRCPYGVQFVKDQNNCGVWVCRTSPAPKATIAPKKVR
ncbi:MAG: hypothetical protein UV61_C0003G0066 [Candidatus Gottesmanbacteria bacterium GW2011_GWB1_43_11]|uniref:Uncharacterized protein n=1 Tax=Candidatus Gottesmanbacteria bacterium GW2011_GWB1_43_11 TaxID=1618446 RepID=A0A0G1FK23_9BACT|nr:MAG: hypothetical protein UV04_C0015G0014 [Candidatus Gottesmanbacteria bacterium GW2011_GWA2_42_16]KKS54590.1 MAG: hypothetical protein UV17_C0016G0002 [Candidatus Gottesmanbacteria bacterium GW2011_GWA1_42_26]KKS82490.1 MAG: hypothetical protein UV55_C0002G0068 [Candidatus Gottesmanbacteria bacterium GW2011_GWC1_43_10]KKS87213.1 MAG: hypothetical protein UV61_C0003G0066 [Candidatus Gottesmanbacteria bacterium GW2011_GWB1_43_11]OGG07580.1 MAG: hypothetical protein A2699_06765 [Candidatus Go